MTFLMGRVFLTIFNKIRDVNKKILLLGKNAQSLSLSLSRKLLHAQSSLGPQTVSNLIYFKKGNFNFFCENHILGDIEQKLKIVRKFCCSSATTQRAQVFRSCKFGFLLLAEVQRTY
jgi:hypothetical protein